MWSEPGAPAAAARRGTLVLVVGPSGVGKDSLIAWCRARLPADAPVVFPQRVITRPAGADAEDHDTVAEAGYAALVRAGGFALHWRAHGLGYGIPASIAAELAAGRNVVVNVSRAVIADARRRFPPVTVVSVTAPAEVLSERLRRRKREATEDIATRLARAAAYAPAGADVVTLDNSGSLDDAGAALLRIVAGAAAPPQAGGVL